MPRIIAPATAGLSLLMATSALSATCTDSAFNLIAADATETCDVTFSGAAVLIASGVTLGGDDHGVRLNGSSPASVTNLGTVDVARDAVNADGAGVSVFNFGRMIAGDDGIQGGDDLTVVNTGTIRATDEAINADATGLNLTNSGRIVALTGKAVDTGDGAEIVNSGRILAVEDEAVNTGDGLNLVNTGRIVSRGDRGVDTGDGSRIVNEGAIVATVDEGIEMGDDATVLNYGRIAGFDDAIQVGERAYILNAGRIVNTQTAADLADPDVEAQDAIDIDSGTIVNLATGVIRSTTNAAIDFDPGAEDSTIYNYGRIRGTVAVGVDGEDTAGQHVINHGVLIGTSGTALDLGLGNDSLELHAGARMRGGADFGAGDDGLSIFAGLAGMIGGIGAILDGGDDFDTVSFIGLTLGDIVSASFVDDVLNLGFGGFGVALTNWESYSFGKDAYTTDELVATIAPVPLPASVALMIPALGLLGWAGRRRRG